MVAKLKVFSNDNLCLFSYLYIAMLDHAVWIPAFGDKILVPSTRYIILWSLYRNK